MRYNFLVITLLLAGCIQKTNKSDLFLNQGNCVTLGGDRISITNGDIKLKLDEYLIGKITVVDKTTISVMDDTGVRKNLHVDIETRDGKRLLYSVTEDRKYIPFSCGLN
jgi:hypothetical protein